MDITHKLNILPNKNKPQYSLFYTNAINLHKEIELTNKLVININQIFTKNILINNSFNKLETLLNNLLTSINKNKQSLITLKNIINNDCIFISYQHKQHLFLIIDFLENKINNSNISYKNLLKKYNNFLLNYNNNLIKYGDYSVTNSLRKRHINTNTTTNNNSILIHKPKIKTNTIETSIIQLNNLFTQLTNIVLLQKDIIINIEDDIESGLSNTIVGNNYIEKVYNNALQNRSIIIKVFLLLIFFIFIFLFKIQK